MLDLYIIRFIYTMLDLFISHFVLHIPLNFRGRIQRRASLYPEHKNMKSILFEIEIEPTI